MMNSDKNQQLQQQENQASELFKDLVAATDSKPLHFAAFMGGKWQDTANHITITAEDFDELTADDFKYPACAKHFQGVDKSYNIAQAKHWSAISCQEVLVPGVPIRFAADVDGYDTSSDKPPSDDPDLIKNINDVREMFKYFDELAMWWSSPYSILAYTNDKAIAEEFPCVEYIEHAAKVFSGHIDFYMKRMTPELYQQLFSLDPKGQYIFSNLRYQDKNIWQPLTNLNATNGHCIRFGMCDKIKRDTICKGKVVQGFKKECAVSCVRARDGSKLPNSCGLWLADGTEDELTLGDLALAKIMRRMLVLELPPQKVVSALTIKDIVYQPKETMSKDISNTEVIAEILEHVHEDDNERSYSLLEKVEGWVCNVHLWSKADALEFMDTWYNGGSNVHSNPGAATSHINSYYDKEPKFRMSAKSFFYKLMSKVIDPNERQELIDKYAPDTLDDTIQVGSDPTLSINTLTQADHRYDISDYAKLVQDIRKVAAFYNGVYFVLKSDNCLEAMTDVQLTKAYPHRVFYKNNHISLAMVIINSVNYISYSSTEFVEPSKHINVNCFNMFHGYKYEPKQNDAYADDFVGLVSFLVDNDKARTVWHEPYDRSTVVLKWLSEIVKHPGTKTRYAIVLQGQQGVGKGTLTDIFGELLRGYSLPNINSMEQITGKFNTALLGIMYANCNELQSAVDAAAAKRVDFNALKTRITDPEMMYELKGGRAWNDISVCNYTFNTNNALAFTIEIGDRRYIVFNTNGDLKGHDDYFNECHEWIKDADRMSAILYYLLHYDEKNEIKVNGLYMTPEKYHIIEGSASDVFLLLVDNAKALSTDGLSEKDINKLRHIYGISGKLKTFRALMAFYCDVIGGKYKLKDGYYSEIIDLITYRTNILGVSANVKMLELKNEDDTGSIELVDDDPKANKDKDKDKDQKQADDEPKSIVDMINTFDDSTVTTWIDDHTITSHKKTYILIAEINEIEDMLLRKRVSDAVKTWRPDKNLYNRDDKRGSRGYVKP